MMIVDTNVAALMSHIYGNIYMCGSEYTNEDLHKYNISYLINVTKDTPMCISPLITNYHQFPIDDVPYVNILPYVNQAVCIIDAARRDGRNILVHCHMGISRSASVVIGYLMLHLNCDYTTAYEMVRQKRSCIAPNGGFREQLRSLDMYDVNNVIII
jgi:protein-tyrosine phosphatase